MGTAATPEEKEQIPLAEAPATPLPSPSPPAQTTAEPTPEATTEPADLDGTWVVTACDLQLFTQGFNQSILVGAVEVENTGNVPALVSVSLKWDALPGPLPDGGTKEVTLNPGASRELTTKINGGDVDRVQSSPGYGAASDEKFCKVKASIEEA